MPKKETAYKEPDDYFPKELRKKFGLGEYNKDEGEDEKKKSLKKRKDLPDEITKRKAAKK